MLKILSTFFFTVRSLKEKIIFTVKSSSQQFVYHMYIINSGIIIINKKFVDKSRSAKQYHFVKRWSMHVPVAAN